MRRTLLITGTVLVAVILLAVVAYFLFFRASSPGITAGTGQNPFGEGTDVTPGSGTGGTTPDSGATATEVAPHLVRITSGPVAYGTIARVIPVPLVIPASGSSTATTTRTAYETDVRYAERESGNIYDYNLNERTLTRISNKTLPGIQEASWTADGTTAFLRFLSDTDNGETVDTYALPVGEDDGGYFLEAGLGQVLISGSSTVVTLLPSTTGSIATTAHVDGAAPKTLFSSALSSLRLYAAGKGYAAATKASASAGGYGFMVSAGGAFTRVLGPLSGLTILPSPSGKSVLYSYDSGNSVVAGVLDVATRAVTSLPIAALPDKCVWAADESAVYCGVPRTMSGTWPDDWYQGTVSFSDRLWKVDLLARNASLIVDPVAVANVAIDAVSLAIDPRSDALFFTNKKDGSLWAYDL